MVKPDRRPAMLVAEVFLPSTAPILLRSRSAAVFAPMAKGQSCKEPILAHEDDQMRCAIDRVLPRLMTWGRAARRTSSLSVEAPRCQMAFTGSSYRQVLASGATSSKSDLVTDGANEEFESKFCGKRMSRLCPARSDPAPSQTTMAMLTGTSLPFTLTSLPRQIANKPLIKKVMRRMQPIGVGAAMHRTCTRGRPEPQRGYTSADKAAAILRTGSVLRTNALSSR